MAKNKTRTDEAQPQFKVEYREIQPFGTLKNLPIALEDNARAQSVAIAMVAAAADMLTASTVTLLMSTKSSSDCDCSSQRVNDALPMQSTAHMTVRLRNRRWTRGRSLSSSVIG